MATIYTLSSLIADDCHHGVRTAVRLYVGSHYASRDVAVEAALRLLRAALWNNAPRVHVRDDWFKGEDRRRVYAKDSGQEFGLGDVTITESEHGVHARCGLLVRARGSWTESRYVPCEGGLYKQEPAVFRPPGVWAPVLRRCYAPFATRPHYDPVTLDLDVVVNAVDVLDEAPEYFGEVD